jgi:peptide subunit release factor 1 (eRF1)
MIRREDLERLVAHPTGRHPILSLFLDMSVDETNQRTYTIFLNRKRAEFRELNSDRPAHHRAALGEVLARIERWLEEEFQPENRGVAIYAEVGGEWFEAFQFPVPVANRMLITDRPVIAPLAEVLSGDHHHGVVLVDREHLRILSVYLGRLLDELELQQEPYPTAHDVQGGGYAHQRYQRRKLEETRHFMHDFARELEQFVQQHDPDDLVILGTAENVGRLKAVLPEHLLKHVVHTGPARIEEPASELIAELEPLLRRLRQEERERLSRRLHERVQQDYRATAGMTSTLTALQEGRVETLVIGGDSGISGSRCPKCGFLFGPGVGVCMYDGTPTAGGVALIEELVRMAETSGVEVEFLDPPALDDLRGVGALLRY